MNTNRDGAVEKRVLVVDDERLLREVVRLVLGKAGFTVVESNNGAEALALFAKGRFDMVIVDYQMPFLKGNELAAAIRRIAPRQSIVMVSGFRREAGPDNPVDAVLGKPLDYTRLRILIERLLNEAGARPAPPCLAQTAQSN
jgi:DNA-binding response OmpR family regulator